MTTHTKSFTLTVCPNCGEEREVRTDYLNHKDFIGLCKRCCNFLFPPPINRGEKNPNWKGGRSKDRKVYQLLWQRQNRDKVTTYNHTRIARVKVSEGSFTEAEWKELKERYNYKCLSCGEGEPEILLTPDHIIPLALGGSSFISNIQPLCFSCNRKKHTKEIDYAKV